MAAAIAVQGPVRYRTPRSVLWRRRAVAVVIAVGVVATAGRAAAALGGVPLAASGPAPSVTTYVVEPGDTLWTVAEQVAPDSDPRPVVDALVRARGSAAVIPGETITWVAD